MLTWTHVIARIWILALGWAIRHAMAAPTPSDDINNSSTHTSLRNNPTSNPNPNPNPYGADPSNDNSSPMTTIIIVCVVGSLALIGGGWAAYRCMVSRRNPQPVFAVPTDHTGEPTTAMIYIPGEPFPTTAMPALRYDSPYTHPQPDLEATEVGPGAIMPPPPSYDAATGGRVPELATTPGPCRPIPTPSESRWKDLLMSQGRD